MNEHWRRTQVVIGYLFAAGFMLLAAALGVVRLVAALSDWTWTHDYIEAPAFVVWQSPRDEPLRSFKVALRYEFDGKAYETTRMSVLRDQDKTLAVNADVIDRLRREDGRTSVWVDPLRPEVAVASRDLPWSSMWPLLPRLVALMLLCAAGLLSARHAHAGYDMLDSLVLTTAAGLIGAPTYVELADEALRANESPSSTFGLGILMGFGLIFALMAFIGAMSPNAPSSANGPSS